MKGPIGTSIACVVGMMAVSAVSRAEVISLVENNLSGLLGEGYGAIGSITETEMSVGNLHAVVNSQAFSGDGIYAYLYQVVNTGVTGNSAVEMLVLGEFWGELAAGEIGYLTDGVGLPDGFVGGGQVPESDAFVDPLPQAQEISFYYTKRWGYEISPGEHSRVMFVLSEYAPGIVGASLIDGTVAYGHVVGAVPEPTAIVLLVGGLLFLACHRVRRK